MNRNFFIVFITVITLGGALLSLNAQNRSTDFEFTETAPEHIRKAMQTNAKAVFDVINRSEGDGLKLSTSNATSDAIGRIQALWTTSRFWCTEARVVTRVLRTTHGYQVRNVPAFFVMGETPEDKNQGLVIEFNVNGLITDVYPMVFKHNYPNLIENSNNITDLRHRQQVADFIEQFRNAYNRRDIDYLNKVYSNEALIITGKVLTPKKSDAPSRMLDAKYIEYTNQTKKEYLSKLRRVFSANACDECIRIQFDNIHITQHKSSPNVYGVLLKQKWRTRTYGDDGWLFLMIDYSNEDEPMIWVRTWQPLYDSFGNDINYKPEDIFGLGHFKIK
jgi:hypothetical protein